MPHQHRTRDRRSRPAAVGRGLGYISLMATSYPEPGGQRILQQPVILLESFSPYGSRKVTVEYDGQVTAAYLHDDTSVISATWIANHRPAPQATDQARLDAGRAPLMPAARTKHPGGRPPALQDRHPVALLEPQRLQRAGGSRPTGGASSRPGCSAICSPGSARAGTTGTPPRASSR